jgi:adenylate kinase family enzyme
MIMGPSGSGKSTLARTLGAQLGLPVTHLDRLFWQPGWVQPDERAFRAKIVEAVAGEAWVIEGNYSRHLDLRLWHADTLIWLDLPRRVYFPATVWRMMTHYGRQRSDIGPGCPEPFDWPFFRDWVWTYPTRGRPKQVVLMASLPAHIAAMTLTSRREIARLIADLPGSLPTAPA